MCKVVGNTTIERQAEGQICELVTSMPQMACQSFVQRGWESMKDKCRAPGVAASDITPSDVMYSIENQFCGMSGSTILHAESEVFTCGFLSTMVPQVSQEMCADTFEKAWSTSARECPTTTTGAPEYLASLGWNLAGKLYCRYAGCQTTTTTPSPQLSDILPAGLLPFLERGFCKVAGNTTLQKETESRACSIVGHENSTSCQTSADKVWVALQQKCLDPKGIESLDEIGRWIGEKFCLISGNGLAMKGLVDLACSLMQEREERQMPKQVCTSVLEKAWKSFAAKCHQTTPTTSGRAVPDVLV